MKVLSKLATLLFVIVLALVGMSPAVFAEGSNGNSSLPKSVEGYPIPKELGGLPVIFVHTPENTRGLQPGEVRLVVLDTAASPEESVSRSTLPEYLNKHPLPEGWLVFGIGGPNTSGAEYEKLNAEANDFYDKFGPLPKLGPSSSTRAESISVQTAFAAHHAYAVDQNLDPGTMTVTNQSVEWNAPQVGNNQNGYSALLNNGWTNTNAFLQVGQVYSQGIGQNGYATSPNYNFVQFMNVPYVVGHMFYFVISYGSSQWQLSARDMQTQAYEWVLISGAGSRLVLSDDTGVFFENVNTNANWYTGFTNPINVSYAFDRGYQWWVTDSIYQKYTGGGHLPINGAITGHLAQFNTASFHLDKILLAY